MMKLTTNWIKENGLLIFEAIIGSRAYGLETENSDTDIRGVFVLPINMYYSLSFCDQVSNASNDIVYYELRRFLELLSKNNPNILEMLALPKQFILQNDSIMNHVEPSLFLSKLCEKTFAQYAFTQIKKAYGLEKKIVNPIPEIRKGVSEFCYVFTGNETVSLKEFLEQNDYDQATIGLSAIPHFRDTYNVYYSTTLDYSGIAKNESANDINLSSIPKGEVSIAILYFNKDGYSVYCKKYKEYWEWVAKRNEARFKTTMLHGRKYDSKNMMHVFRLLFMAREIAIEKRINVHRSDRDYLLQIKNGIFEYDDLVLKAEELKKELPDLYRKSQLQDSPDINMINSLVVKMRKEYYSTR